MLNFAIRKFERKYGCVSIDVKSLKNSLRFNRRGEFGWIQPIKFYLDVRLLEAREVKRDFVLELFIRSSKTLFIAEAILNTLNHYTKANIWVQRALVLNAIRRLNQKEVK